MGCFHCSKGAFRLEAVLCIQSIPLDDYFVEMYILKGFHNICHSVEYVYAIYLMDGFVVFFLYRKQIFENDCQTRTL